MKFFRAASFLLLFPLLPLPVAADAASRVRASLISETQEIRAGQPFWVAVRLQMEPRWHTYWKNPGESGSPTEIHWELPPGFKAGPIHWPFPQRIEMGPVTTYAYENDVLLLTKIHPPSQLRAPSVRLAARVDWLECEVECVPGSAPVELTLPVTTGAPAPDPRNAPLFSTFRARLPLESSDWVVSAARRPGGYQLKIVPPANSAPLGDLDFFPGERNVLKDAALPVVERAENLYLVELTASETADAPAARITGVLVSENGWRGPGSEKALQVGSVVEGAPVAADSPSLAFALLLAFLGGLLLNLMPCVLPILSIKILGFVQSAAGDRRAAFRQSLVFSLGILVSFWALAGGLLALRAGGEQLGWGFQLQAPGFVLFLASLFFLLGLSLIGVFEIGASATRLGGALAGRSGATGAFLSGILATLVATPCTAPFMGSALGYALAQPTAVAFAVFTSLAIGLALPYVILSAHPAFLRFVPRPGPWMETFRQFLGFLLIGTVVWLLWVLAHQTGADGVAAALGALFVQSMAAWIWGRWTAPHLNPTRRRLAIAAALILTVGSFVAAVRFLRPAAASASQAETTWEPYSDARVAELRAEGRAVFVDFTAAWCLTCQVNKRVALNTVRVGEAFQSRNVATLRADWTSRDPAITKALARFGRSGVPVYALYPPDPRAEARLLPAILTSDIVIDALDDLNSDDK